MTKPHVAPPPRRALARAGTLLLLVAGLALALPAARGPGWAAGDGAGAPPVPGPGPASQPGTLAHRDLVMTSAYCATCHPVIYAEHQENTHGRAFVDPEARLATRGMKRDDCIRCHTPRPIFETGIGVTPTRRHHNLEDGNSCMTCHWKAGYDYSRFVGGPECKGAFDPRAGSVLACASCHRLAATPEQWSRAANGRRKGRTCMTCHMPQVLRPVAVGTAPRMVHTHLFPAADNEAQVRRAYTYTARIEDGALVVRIENSGAGHNFNTGTAQRALESLVIVRDPQGKELYRSRMVFGNRVLSPELMTGKDLSMPHNFQIPSGWTQTHRVPLRVSDGTVESRLYFKRYHPSADTDTELSLLLEMRTQVFSGITPSDEPVQSTPGPKPVGTPPPPATPAQAASVEGLVKFAHPKPGTKKVDIPSGQSPEDIQALLALFNYPVPYAQAQAVDRLVAIGAPAVPALVRTLGSWSNESFKRARTALVRIGAPAVPALTAALDDDDLYVRRHALQALEALGFPGDRAALRARLLRGLGMPAPLDRESAARALGAFGDASTAGALQARLGDADWDVVVASAWSLARLGDRDAVPALRRALHRATFTETRRDLALAMAELGAADGVPVLIDGLSQRDVLLRQSAFEALFDVTGIYQGYDPNGAPFDRVRAIRRIREAWAHANPRETLRQPQRVAPEVEARAWTLVRHLGGGTDVFPGGDDAALRKELIAMGSSAVPALVRGLTGFPRGFVLKRALLCEILGRIGDGRAAPYLAWTLSDPTLPVAAWACWALEQVGNVEASPPLERYAARLRHLAAQGEVHGIRAPLSRLLAQAACTRVVLGDGRARGELTGYLLSQDVGTRRIAIGGLAKAYGSDRGFDPDAPLAARRKAYAAWQQGD
jgi:HEAT repeat protein